jgi:tRNA dimethylallyltransferase
MGVQPRPPAVFVMGPTAAGKTDLAVALASRFPCDIVSVDSALVYRGMDIGTAKPNAAVLARAPHRLVDICEPTEAYSAARFRADALREMAEISDKGRVPLLVGGTMLYFRALERGLAELPSADAQVRAGLEHRMANEGLAVLHARLSQIDPEAAARIHPNDPQRTLRALEVYELTGRPLSSLQAAAGEQALPYRVCKIVCAPAGRTVLADRISARFRRMLDEGLEAEVAALLALPGVTRDLPSMRSVGYRQVAAWLAGACDRDEMIERAVRATRQLAKRQMTWLRRETSALWLDPAEPGTTDRALRWIERHIATESLPGRTRD